LLLWSGSFAEASSPYQESVAIWKGLGIETALYDVATGAAELVLGHYDRARDWGQMGLANAREAGNQREIGLALLVLGAVALARGTYTEAER
jgi:hypothetical protein